MGGLSMISGSRYLLLLLVISFLVGCGEKLTEEQMRAKAIEYENKEQWDEAIKLYEKIAKKWKDSPKADETLFKLGILYANNLHDFEKSIEAYQKLIDSYPNSKYLIQATFMIGYRYGNDIKDYDKARKAYENFLEKWPNHELASSVKWELEHLGQDIGEISLDFEDADQAMDK
jgi:TolA-binding protein